MVKECSLEVFIQREIEITSIIKVKIKLIKIKIKNIIEIKIKIL